MINIEIPDMDFDLKVGNWRDQMSASSLNEYDRCYAFLTEIKWKKGGVYLLHDPDGGLLYVGRSLNVKSRIITHISGKDPATKEPERSIDRVSGFYVSDVADQEIYEAYAIKTFRPALNRAKTERVAGNYGSYHHVQIDRHGDGRYGQRGTKYNYS